jgi:hypothetical protein
MCLCYSAKIHVAPTELATIRSCRSINIYAPTEQDYLTIGFARCAFGRFAD